MEWEPRKLSELTLGGVIEILHLGERNARRENKLVGVNYLNRPIDFGFVNQLGRFFLVKFLADDYDSSRAFVDFVEEQIVTETIFTRGEGALSLIGSRPDFKEYSNRLKYLSVELDDSKGVHEVDIIYGVGESLLELDTANFKKTTYDYAIRPTLYWIHQMSLRV